MGYYVSVSIDITSTLTPSQIVDIVKDFTPEVEIDDIDYDGEFSYWHYASCDFKYSQDSERTLLMAITALKPIPTKSTPNIVFCDDLEQRLWGYQVSEQGVVPYVAVLQPEVAGG